MSALAAHIALSSEPAAVAATRGVREGHRFVLLSLGGAVFSPRENGEITWVVSEDTALVWGWGGTTRNCF